MYVTISGTAHGEEDDVTDPTDPEISDMWLSCEIDSLKCNPGFGDTPSGYVAITEETHDLSFYATWCISLPNLFGAFATPNTYPVRILMVSDEAN